MESFLILLKKIFRFLGAFKHFISYTTFLSVFHLICFTIITYFLIPSKPKFQDINDLYFANQIVFLGIGSLLYVLFLLALNPLAKTTFGELISTQRFKRKLLPGITLGTLLSFSVLSLFHFSQNFEFLGFYVQLEELHLWLFNFTIKAVCLVVLIFSEEFLFRQKILNSLKKIFSPFAATLITAVLYMALKTIQFDLDIMQIVTIFLISLSLSALSTIEGDFTKGAGILIGLYFSFHSVFSLPILGNESQGLFISRYISNPLINQSSTQTPSTLLSVNPLENQQHNSIQSETLQAKNLAEKSNLLNDAESRFQETTQMYLKNMTWTRFLYGGKSGPLSSFILQSLFIFLLLQIFYRFRTIWFNFSKNTP